MTYLQNEGEVRLGMDLEQLVRLILQVMVLQVQWLLTDATAAPAVVLAV